MNREKLKEEALCTSNQIFNMFDYMESPRKWIKDREQKRLVLEEISKKIRCAMKAMEAKV